MHKSNSKSLRYWNDMPAILFYRKFSLIHVYLLDAQAIWGLLSFRLAAIVARGVHG